MFLRLTVDDDSLVCRFAMLFCPVGKPHKATWCPRAYDTWRKSLFCFLLFVSGFIFCGILCGQNGHSTESQLHLNISNVRITKRAIKFLMQRQYIKIQFIDACKPIRKENGPFPQYNCRLSKIDRN